MSGSNFDRNDPIRPGTYAPIRSEFEEDDVDDLFPKLKVRSSAYDLLETRQLYHQQQRHRRRKSSSSSASASASSASEDITTEQQRQTQTRDFLKYEEVPFVTNMSRSETQKGEEVERHQHDSKYEIFEVLRGKGEFRIWAKNAKERDRPREIVQLREGIVVTVAPREPHSIKASDDSDGPLVMTYIGIIAPEQK